MLLEVSVFFNFTTFSEDVKIIFYFTNKLFHLFCYDWNHVSMEGLGYKPLRMYLVSTNRVYIKTSLLIDGKVLVDLF